MDLINEVWLYFFFLQAAVETNRYNSQPVRIRYFTEKFAALVEGSWVVGYTIIVILMIFFFFKVTWWLVIGFYLVSIVGGMAIQGLMTIVMNFILNDPLLDKALSTISLIGIPVFTIALARTILEFYDFL